MRLLTRHLGLFLLTLLWLAGCAPAGPQPTRLTLGAYSAVREVYAELIPLFQRQYLAATGQAVFVETAYVSSGAQARAIVNGFDADVAALSLQADMDRIVRAGLITHPWQARPFSGTVSASVVVIGVRAGNPLRITDWHDLARPGLRALTPNPHTSGGAMWNMLALYGAAERGWVQGVPANDPAAARAFLTAVLKNVPVMDKGARESLTNFEAGIGDVIITYENEILVGRAGGQTYEYIIPRSTIRIDNPVAVVDGYADPKGTRAVAEAFVDFLFTPSAQAVFARWGFRSPDPAAPAGLFPPVTDLFTIEYFGGWSTAAPAFFGPDGVYSHALAAAQR